MSNSTSIGRGPAHGSNENHDGDPRNKTMGETTSQDAPPVGSELIEEAAPEARPRELDAARGKLPGEGGKSGKV